MKKIKLLALSIALAGTWSGFSTTAVAADITANVAAASNYLFRGQTLSGDAAAISGGVDYSHESGAYAGMWQSTATPSPETDLYAGYAGEAGEFSYDVGYLAYVYLQAEGADYEEIYFTGGWKFAELFYAVTPTKGAEANYVSLSLSYENYSFVYGSYKYDAVTSTDYTHFDIGVDLTDELNLTYSKNDQDNQGRLVIAYGLEFEL